MIDFSMILLLRKIKNRKPAMSSLFFRDRLPLPILYNHLTFKSAKVTNL